MLLNLFKNQVHSLILDGVMKENVMMMHDFSVRAFCTGNFSHTFQY